jgi:hypothetical protein
VAAYARLKWTINGDNARECALCLCEPLLVKTFRPRLEADDHATPGDLNHALPIMASYATNRTTDSPRLSRHIDTDFVHHDSNLACGWLITPLKYQTLQRTWVLTSPNGHSLFTDTAFGLVYKHEPSTPFGRYVNLPRPAGTRLPFLHADSGRLSTSL